VGRSTTTVLLLLLRWMKWRRRNPIFLLLWNNLRAGRRRVGVSEPLLGILKLELNCLEL
jgi:hypothetical protein